MVDLMVPRAAAQSSEFSDFDINSVATGTPTSWILNNDDDDESDWAKTPRGYRSNSNTSGVSDFWCPAH